MSITIGRVGADITLAEVGGWQEQADGSVEIQGWMSNATVAQVEHLRDQLLGLVGSPDEPIVPVTVGHDDSRNGWYWVLDADVEHVLGVTEDTGDRKWRARIRRTPWWDQPRMELKRTGGVVTNAHSVTTSSHTSFIAIPNTCEAVDSGTDTGTLSRGSRTAETGTMAFITGTATGAALYNTVVSYDLPLADAYDGAATIEVDVSGVGGYKPVVGRQVRREHKTSWRLNNGLIQVAWHTGDHGLGLSVYDGSSWETIAPRFILTDDTSYTTVDEDPISWAVLRNDPTMVTIRLVMDYEAGTSRIQWDISLRRGDRNLINVVKSRTSTQWGLEQSGGAYATTAITGAWRLTSDDANGNRWLISSPKATTADLVNGPLRLTSASQVFPFGIGVELGGSGSAGQAQAQNVAYHYYAQAIESPAVSGV